MTPSRFAASLRHIAARIDASRRPSRQLVAADVRRVLAGMDVEDVEEKQVSDAVADALQRTTRRIVTQWGGADVPYSVSFPRVDEARSSQEGDGFDAVVEFLPDGRNNPLGLSPFTLHLRGAWDGFGQVGADVVSGDLEQVLGPDAQAFVDYLTVHVNGIVRAAFEAAAP